MITGRRAPRYPASVTSAAARGAVVGIPQLFLTSDHPTTPSATASRGWREKDDPHIGVAVGAVVVRELGGGPGDPVGGNDRRAALDVNCQDAAGCVYEVSPCVRLHCACFAGWPEVAPTRGPHM
jgi:hypothetical protein